MEESQLRNFLSVVESGSISRAAQVIGIAQPSLSQQILRLEDELKFTLFNRSTRGVSLTETGRVFEVHARDILEAMQRAREHVGAYEAVPHGVVSIVVPSSTNQVLGLPLMMACRERFPEVALKLQEATSGATRLTIMAANGSDLAIVFCAERSPQRTKWVPRWVADETLFLVGRGGEFGEVDERGVAIHPVGAEFPSRVNMISPSIPRTMQPDSEHDRAAYVFGFRVGMEIDSLQQIIALVAAGQGYSILPHAAISDDLRNGRLSAARIDGVDMSRSVSIVRNTGKPITRAALEVEEMAFTLLRQMIADGTWVVDGRARRAEGAGARLAETDRRWSSPLANPRFTPAPNVVSAV